MERDILADLDHPFIVRLHYGQSSRCCLLYSAISSSFYCVCFIISSVQYCVAACQLCFNSE